MPPEIMNWRRIFSARWGKCSGKCTNRAVPDFQAIVNPDSANPAMDCPAPDNPNLVKPDPVNPVNLAAGSPTLVHQDSTNPVPVNPVSDSLAADKPAPNNLAAASQRWIRERRSCTPPSAA